MSKKQKVGLIGVGLMGHGMGHNILEGGFDLRVLAHRNRARVDDLVGRGAIEMPSIAALTRDADVVLCCLPSVRAITEVIGGPDGVLDHLAANAVLVDTSTSTPVLAKGFAERAAARGAGFVDAALMKGPKQAMEGTLNAIAGGSDADMAAVTPILETFAETIFHVGAVGSGCTVKLLNQAIGLGTHAVVSEAFVLAAMLGIDTDTLFRIVDSGQASSRKLQSLAQKFTAGDYGLNFATEVALKDLRLCERMAADAESRTPVLNAVSGLFALNAALGHGGEDVSTLAPLLGKLVGIDFATAAKKTDTAA